MVLDRWIQTRYEKKVPNFDSCQFIFSILQVMTFTKDCHGRRRGDLVQSSDYRVDLKTLKITHCTWFQDDKLRFLTICPDRIPQCKNEWVKKEYLEDISIPTRRATATWPYDYKFTNQGYLPDMANRQKPKVKESEKTIQGKNGVRKKAKK